MDVKYLRESLSDILEEHDVLRHVSSETLKSIASDLAVCLDNYGTYMDHDCIPNPENAEVARLKKIINEERERQNRREDLWCRAAKRALDVKDNVILSEDGYIEFFP